jgi:mevalonate kinase
MKRNLKARSPAKLILSGEHAVVYGHPALAIAVDRYAESSISHHLLPTIFFNFLNLDYAKSFTHQALTVLKHRLQEQYHGFLKGQCHVRDVLKMPFELLQFTVSNFLEKWNVSLPHGIEIHTSSNIPMGCGMGSSAASVMSTLYALAHFLKLDIDHSRFLSLGREAENLQHGRSSGLDLQLTLEGGFIKFKQGIAEKRSNPNINPFTIIQTGVPDSSTGQCVEQAAVHFTETSIGHDFQMVTEAMDQAFGNQNLLEVKRCVQENHRLLVKIGVVPEKVQAFINEIELRGAAAKICGAGAVVGEKGGVVWLLSDPNISINDILIKYGYTIQTLRGDFNGTQIV